MLVVLLERKGLVAADSMEILMVLKLELECHCI